MNEPSPIRWGILATGSIANLFVEDLARLPDAEVVAVASRQVETANAFAHRHGIPRAYGTWHELAADPEVDVVYVATPHSAHHAATAICIEAGKAVLCEKPLTVDLATAQDLVDLARAKGVFLMEAMWMLTNPLIRRVAELIAGGAIGEVTHIAADFGLAGPIPVGHRLRAPELGGGALLDLGVYPVTLAHYLLGRPQTITAQAHLFPEGTDEQTALLLGYEGALATIQCGAAGNTAIRAFITGRTGRIEIDPIFFRPDRFTIFRDGGEPEQVELELRGHGMVYEAEEVMRCLRAGRLESELIPLDATLDVMATLDTALGQIRRP